MEAHSGRGKRRRKAARYEHLVDEGLSLAVSEAKVDVAAGREKMVPWEEAKAALESCAGQRRRRT